MTTEAIKAAKAAMAAASLKIGEAEKVMASAKAAMDAARKQLGAALLARDTDLPKCIFRTTNFRSGRCADKEVCIIKRTAKSVFVRHIGQDDDVGDQYRQDGSEAWVQYPAPKYQSNNYCQLIFKDGTP